MDEMVVNDHCVEVEDGCLSSVKKIMEGKLCLDVDDNVAAVVVIILVVVVFGTKDKMVRVSHLTDD